MGPINDEQIMVLWANIKEFIKLGRQVSPFAAQAISFHIS